MELWIRSQNKEKLIKSENLKYGYGTFGHIILNGEIILGEYKSKERALEILDEIQAKLRNKFLCKPNCLMKRKDIDREELIMNRKYGENFIMQFPTIDIEPINCDIVVYEMPKE